LVPAICRSLLNMKPFYKLFIISFLSLILIFYCQEAYTQLEAKNWLFGSKCGLTFEKDSLNIKNNIGILFGTGVSTISDKDGNLLFYSNGETIWNKNHDTLKNGGSINGNKGSKQSALFIPMPDNPDIYYVFTAIGLNGYSNPGFWYHIIDRTKDNGNGELILKNQFICGNVCQRMTATMHADRKSIWIIIREWNSKNFKAFKLNNIGFSTVPVTSSQGFTSQGPDENIVGHMKVSPSGNKIVDYMSNSAFVDLCDFNNFTGKVSNAITINFQVDSIFKNTRIYGIEFSPNEKFLYLSSFSPIRVYQADISSNNELRIKNSIINILPNEASGYVSGIQIGLDQKIYLNQNNGVADRYLACIERPNLKGDSCMYIPNAIHFIKRVGSNLPNFMQSYFFLPEIEIENLCFNDSTAFSLADTANIDSVLWKFGDGDSMVEMFPKHVYADTGIYQVEAILFFDNQNDTFSRELRISNYAYANFSIQDTFQCLHGNEFLFYDSSHAIDGSMTYKWDFGDSTFLFSQNPSKSYNKADTFPVTLTVTSSYGCESSVTKNVYVQPLPELDIQINDSVQCFNENSFSFFNKADSFNYINSKKWYFGDGDSSYADTAFHSYNSFDSFRITLIEETIFGCWDTSYKDVVVHPSPKANFSFNDSAKCFNEQMLVAWNSSLVARDSIVENKWIVNSDTVLSEDLGNYAFDSSGVYQVQLIVTTANICRDTMEKQMEILPSPKAAISINDSAQCFNQNSFMFSNPWGFQNPNGLKVWYFGDNQTSNSDTASHSYVSADTFQVTLIEETDLGCRDTAYKDVVVHPSPIADFAVNDSVQCFNENNFKLTNQSQFSDLSKLNHWWDLGDMTIVNNTDVTHTYSTEDTFTITLETQTPKGCKDKLSKQVVVLPSPKALFSMDDSAQCFNTQSLVARNSSLVFGDSITKTSGF
jgi:PKD repeat protein